MSHSVRLLTIRVLSFASKTMFQKVNFRVSRQTLSCEVKNLCSKVLTIWSLVEKEETNHSLNSFLNLKIFFLLLLIIVTRWFVHVFLSLSWIHCILDLTAHISSSCLKICKYSFWRDSSNLHKASNFLFFEQFEHLLIWSKDEVFF